MYYSNNETKQGEWLIPPGRYIGTLESVYRIKKGGDTSDSLKIVFSVKTEEGNDQRKLAGKEYSPDRPKFLERDLKSWLGKQQLTGLFPNGVICQENLETLIGKKAVLDIKNIHTGREIPLVVIDEILPPKRRFLKVPTAVQSGPTFHFSFASNP